jgi:hypothetical protein
MRHQFALIPGRRYTFYYNKTICKHISSSYFSANFIKYNEICLHVNQYTNDQEQIYEDSINVHSMPIEWIDYVESLDTMIGDALVIPEDIILMIDSFL